MASLDRLEGDVTEGAGLLLFLFLIALIVLGYLAWKDISLPSWMYPDTAWGNFSTWVDEVLGNSKAGGGKIQASADNFLATVFGWINEHLPRTPLSKIPGDNSGSGQTIGTGTGMGNQITSYSSDASAGYAEPENYEPDAPTIDGGN